MSIHATLLARYTYIAKPEVYLALLRWAEKETENEKSDRFDWMDTGFYLFSEDPKTARWKIEMIRTKSAPL